MRINRVATRVAAALVGAVVAWSGAGAVALPVGAQREIDRLAERLLVPPPLKAEAGFAIRLVVPIGELYSPLFMLPQADGGVIVNDDGLREGINGSRLMRIDRSGRLSVLAGPRDLLTITGLDAAPATFGSYGGQIFTLAVGPNPPRGPHVIQRIDPSRGYTATVFCTLPEAGVGRRPDGGWEARFGPEGTAFAGKFFAVTSVNRTIYQATADGRCAPLVTLDGPGFNRPAGLGFTADGRSMLVSGTIAEAPAGKAGAIVRIAPDGKVDGTPFVQGLSQPVGFAQAPASFGQYGGQWFVTDRGAPGIGRTRTRLPDPDGKIYRVAPDGQLHLVASGFFNPVGLRFVGRQLWVCDINVDFLAGFNAPNARELPDGFVAQINLQ